VKQIVVGALVSLILLGLVMVAVGSGMWSYHQPLAPRNVQVI
jgi:hypothetical protein